MKQSQHFRTRNGKKFVVNAGYQNVKKNVKKHIFKIPGAIRKALNGLSDHKTNKKEMGAVFNIDKKGNTENVLLVPGTKDNVDMEMGHPILAHTHPYPDACFPSGEDAADLVYDRGQEAEIVFSDGQVFALIKTPEVKTLAKIPEKRLVKVINSRLQRHENPTKLYEGLGFKVEKKGKSDKDLIL